MVASRTGGTVAAGYRKGMSEMAADVQLGDVRTWYDDHGEGVPLVLLHPGGADARAFAPNLAALAARFHPRADPPRNLNVCLSSQSDQHQCHAPDRRAAACR